MFGLNVLAASTSLERTSASPLPANATKRERRIALLRSGRRHGSVTRLITPWDIGELTQPFLFLAYCELVPGWQAPPAGDPRWGVATLTLVLSGTLAYRDGTGSERSLTAGGCRWTTFGGRVPHDGGRAAGQPLRVFQLWMGLPEAQERAPAGSGYFAPHEMQEEGPVRVILGQYGRARGAVAYGAPDTNYFHVRLRDGEQWRYLAPDGHNVTWLAVDHGSVRVREGERVRREQIALFGDSQGVIELSADGETSFVLGSARRISDDPFIDSTLTAITRGEEGGGIVQRPAGAQGRR